ncbi:4'-phosphopantetheinyl transferase superfamily protein [Sphingomonas bacterium]|uniref:4'-phosphopantetheinyl transferase family protein n=1 Tax=Sphingomonas bacterium TaxID=1895847 RepID=UPI00260B7E51|nr:4'-phosphopantetheinyl transferase superfamily protein [Sphingomonas bacterium]MDB5677545.1 4-phosphopantetheinyl transferase superfamily protein [Sphingomonas bacterium]
MIAPARVAADLPESGGVALALSDLDVAPEALTACYTLLSPDERDRASRFRYARDRDRYIARRGQLRTLLAAEVDQAPFALRIVEDSYGRPFLADHPDVHFNLSHSNGRALFAVAHGIRVGCDLAWRDPDLACPRVAARLFAPAECVALDALPPEQWVAGFYNCWSRKEAFVKAIGLGLSYSLHAFTVSVAPGEPARLIEGGAGWSVSSFEPAPGFQAALVRGEAERASVG